MRFGHGVNVILFALSAFPLIIFGNAVGGHEVDRHDAVLNCEPSSLIASKHDVRSFFHDHSSDGDDRSDSAN